MLRVKPLIRGIASFAVPAARSSKHVGGTSSPEHCYSIFLRHWQLLKAAGHSGAINEVAELGPGASIGVGLAALIAGCGTYVGLDVEKHYSPEHNLSVFADLVELFRKRTSVPSTGVHRETFPYLDSYDFPNDLTEQLKWSLASERLARIERDLRYGTGEFIKIVVPWNSASVISFSSIDWLLSHAVLEHIDDLDQTYSAISGWLRIGGYSSHLIDFWSHGATTEWNGHYAVSDPVWKIVRGQRGHFINRRPPSDHIELLRTNDFDLQLESRCSRSDGLRKTSFRGDFSQMSDEDSCTRMIFIVARKSAPPVAEAPNV